MNTKLNKSDWIILAVIYTITTIFNIFDYYKVGNKLIEYLIDFPVSTFISIMLILIFFYILIPKFLIEKKQYILFMLFGLLSLTILGSLENVIGYMSGGSTLQDIKFNFDFFKNGLYNGTDLTGLPFGILLTKKFYEGQKDLLEVQKQQKENELKLLRSQLDPHFLFNNLNTLDALVDSNPTKAKEYINRLSLIYRYLIQTKDSEVMELSEELKLAENYIFLIQTRFGKDYDFYIQTKSSITDKYVATGAIQTLLENVVKHNKASENNTIKTTIVIDNDRLKVTNQKSKLRSTNTSFGTGLNNLKTRYKLLTDKEVLVINTEEEFSVSIPVINLDT